MTHCQNQFTVQNLAYNRLEQREIRSAGDGCAQEMPRGFQKTEFPSTKLGEKLGYRELCFTRWTENGRFSMITSRG